MEEVEEREAVEEEKQEEKQKEEKKEEQPFIQSIVTYDNKKKITLIPNSSGDNVSDCLKTIYNKSIIKKMITQ